MGPLGVVGIGHIGGSIAKAWLNRREVLVMDLAPQSTEAAGADGCKVVADVSQMSACELIVVAAPPNVAPHLICSALEAASQAAVTDTCGVRTTIQSAVGSQSRYVGGHPMAGNEGRGYKSADPAIFHGAKWVLTPGPEAAASALAAVCDFVTGLGAEPLLMEADIHDRAVAQVSHLPHVLANALLRGLDGGEERLAAGSFHGATRVGGSNPELWSELWTHNRTHLLKRLDVLTKDLAEFRLLLDNGSRADLAAWVRQAIR